MKIVLDVVILFLGYAVGRISHILGGHLKAPHHWIYGLILIIVGLIYRHSFIGILGLLFGFGLFVSDLKDFLALKFYGVDKPGPKKFWDVD